MGKNPRTPPDYTEIFFKFLRTSGDSRDMNVDGSGTAVQFFWQVPTSGYHSAEISRLTLNIIDAAMGYGEFGGLGAALTNGLKFEILDSDDTILLDFLNGETIKANEDFDILSGSDVAAHPAAGDDMLPFDWDIGSAIPGNNGLVLFAGQKIVITVQDNLTNLTKMRAMVHGRYWVE